MAIMKFFLWEGEVGPCHMLILGHCQVLLGQNVCHVVCRSLHLLLLVARVGSLCPMTLLVEEVENSSLMCLILGLGVFCFLVAKGVDYQLDVLEVKVVDNLLEVVQVVMEC